MPRKRAKAALRRANSTRRQIISTPYDSDSDVSFVQPYMDKKSKVKTRTLMDKISGLALHANHTFQTFVAPDSEGSAEDQSDDGATWARRTRKEVMLRIFDQAGNCATSLRNVADTVAGEMPDACMAGVIPDSDDSSISSDEGFKRRMPVKKMSEAKAHDGSLSEDISVTTDAYSNEEYSSIASPEGSSHWSSEFTSDSDQNSSLKEERRETFGRIAKLRRRRKQFLRRRAMEKSASLDTEDEVSDDACGEEASHHFGVPRLGLKKWTVPIQELRLPEASRVKSAGNEQLLKAVNLDSRKDLAKTVLEEGGEVHTTAIPDLVNTSNENSLVNTSSDEALPRNNNGIAGQRKWKSTGKNMQQLKWKSIENAIPQSFLVGTVLETSHLGPVVKGLLVKRGMYGVGLQLGDVLIRMKTEDVSRLDAETVSGMINNMDVEIVPVTYLRKNMTL